MHSRTAGLAVALIGLVPLIVCGDGLTSDEPPESERAGVRQASTFAGKIVLFGAQRTPGANASIMAVRADMTDLETLLELKQGESVVGGRVAPDGRRLAFSLYRRDDQQPKQRVIDEVKAEVWVLIAGGERRKVGDDGIVVAWSSDSTRLVCSRGRQHAWESFLVDPETRHEQARAIPGTDVVEDASPDGERFALVEGNPTKFFKHPDPKRGTYPLRQICLVRADGTGREALTTAPMQDNFAACFSHDGKWIAYSQRRYYDDGSLRHATMVRGSDGNGERELVHFDRLLQIEEEERRRQREQDARDEAELRAIARFWESLTPRASFKPDSSPRWSPDGRQIVALGFKQIWAPTGRAGMEVSMRTVHELVFASPDTGVVRRFDLREKGLVWVNSIDWR
jgi:dipeptidyl aminopeptidase/acylaminoacyl peptidase